jgi:hypothetical protein
MLWRVEGKGTNAWEDRASVYPLSLCHDGGGEIILRQKAIWMVRRSWKCVAEALRASVSAVALSSPVTSLIPALVSIMIVFRGATPVDWISFQLWHVIDSNIF